MKNVIHAVWKSEALRGHQISDSFALFYERLPTWLSGVAKISGYSIDELLRQASGNDALDWIVVHGEGSLYRSQNKVLDYTEEFIRSLGQDVLAAGHLLNKRGFYCGLHEQFLIVNLKQYKRLGQPDFGAYERREVELHNYVAGPSLHDDYTPQFLKPAEGKSLYTTWTCGWNLINAGIAAGLRFYNLPNELRNEKIYMYPGDETERLLKNIEALYAVTPTGNISQNRVLLYWLGKKLGLSDNANPQIVASYAPRKASVFIYNTELLNPNPGWHEFNNVPKLTGFVGPCAGFLDACFLKNFGFEDSTKLLYFDLNPDSITYKKYLLENFDGNLETFPAFVQAFKAQHPHIMLADNNMDAGYADLKKEFGSLEAFHSVWQRMKGLERNFVRINLYEDYTKLVKLAPRGTGPTLMCISDIFTGTNEMIYGAGNLKKIFLGLIEHIKDEPALILQGYDHVNADVQDFAPKLYQKYFHVSAP